MHLHEDGNIPIFKIDRWFILITKQSNPRYP